MAQQLPILFSEKVNLSQLGISPDSIKFGSLTMDSDKFVCVREKQGDANTLTTVDMSMGNHIERRPIAAEAAIMNPVSKIIALRGGQTLQIFNTEAKAKIKSYKLPAGVNIVFWRWINSKVIAMVTQSSVFHWSMEGSEDPKKIFDRHQCMSGAQIINYQASDDLKWLLVVGISKGENNTIAGNMQLYSTEKKVSQPLQGHAGCFASITKDGESSSRNMFCFVEKKPGQQPKLFIMEVGKEKDAPGGVFRIPAKDIAFPPEAQADFPVSLLATPKHDILYLITKMGFLYLFDVHTGTLLFCNKITNDTVFTTCVDSVGTGITGITSRKGQVLSITLNESTLVPYLVAQNQGQLAIQLASRLNLPGAEDMYVSEFNRLFSSGDIKGAARLAAESPMGALRTMETIQKFQQLPVQPGQATPILQYFQVLLEKGKLNATETLELTRPVLQQNKTQMLENWLKQGKLECSEQLGDMVVQKDAKMALSIYLRANCPEKVVNCFMHTGEYAKIVAYSNKVGYRPDFILMLQNLVRQNPQGAENFAKMLVNNEGGSLVDVAMVVDVFMQLNRIEETTSFLLDALKGNRKEEGTLQTRLLEINLLGGAPQVADAIFGSDMFTYYDRNHIAQLCEKAGLFQRALEHYTDIEDIKRVIVQTHAISADFLAEFFGRLTGEHCIECLNVLLQYNLKTNLQIVVQVASKYSEQLTPEELIRLFESYKSYEGLYYYCGSILTATENPLVHFKYIESASKMGQVSGQGRFECKMKSMYSLTWWFVFAENLTLTTLNK